MKKLILITLFLFGSSVYAGSYKSRVRSLYGKKRFSILANASQNARIHARKRASSNVTAAATRDLEQDSRSRAINNIVDMSSIRNMESLFVLEDSLIKFLEPLYDN